MVQAVLALNERSSTLPKAEVRVTEYDAANCEQLRQSVEEFGVVPVNGGFQNRVEWLTENDNLVLVVDPFSLTKEGKLNSGHLNLTQFADVLRNCWDRTRCVVGFWYSNPQGSTVQEKAERLTAIASLAAEHRATCRAFKFGAYNMVWLGIGKGKQVITAIPNAQQWKSTWLKSVVNEIEVDS